LGLDNRQKTGKEFDLHAGKGNISLPAKTSNLAKTRIGKPSKE